MKSECKNIMYDIRKQYENNMCINNDDNEKKYNIMKISKILMKA